MLQNGWLIIQQAYESYAATGVVQLLLISSVMIILIRDKKKENKHLAYYVIALIIIIFLPPMAYMFGKYLGDEVYWRIFWLIPSVIVIAYAATKLIEQQMKKSTKRMFFCAITILVIFGGKCVYNGENFNKSINAYKLPQEAIDVCDIIAQEGKARVIVPETIISYIRQYDPQIDMLYGRNLGKDLKRGKTYDLLLQLNSSEPDIAYIAERARERECEYVVFANTSIGIDEMINYGYKNCGSTDDYTVFKNIQ